MTRRALGRLLLFLLFLLGALLLLSGGEGAGSAGSSYSRSAQGLLAARLYLESRGAEVDLPEVALDAGGLKNKVLVVVGPFLGPFDDAAVQVVRLHLRRGGRVVYGYSGAPLEGFEKDLRLELGLGEPQRLRESSSLSPAAWLAHRKELYQLEPEPESPLSARLEVAAFETAPQAPASARVFYRAGPGLKPAAFDYQQHRGNVLVLPAALLSNAEVHRAGNAELLELLFASAEGGLHFDEQRHGLGKAEEVQSSGARLGWNVFLLQLLLFYGLGLWALARSFGPTWTEELPSLGSASAFLEQLGTLHHKLGHEKGAAHSLIERSRALDPQIPAALAERQIDSSDDFLDLAREVALHQHPRRSPS